MKIYKSCSTLPIYNLFMIFETENLNYLIKGYKEGKKIKADEEELEKAYENIYFEYKAMSGGKEYLKIIKEKARIDYMEAIYTTATKILESFAETEDARVLVLVNKLSGFSFSTEKDLSKEVDGIIKKTKNIKTRLKILKAKYFQKYKQKYNSVKDNGESFIDVLYKQATQLEVSLKLGYEINVRKMSVIKFQSLIEINERKIKDLENGKAKH